MRLIDAEAFTNQMIELYKHAGWEERECHFSLLDTLRNIESMPTISKDDVKAEWITIDPANCTGRCSNCFHEDFQTNYCSSCGSKMERWK